MPVQAKGAVFSAEIVPATGAATGWADMRAAYEALDDETRRAVAGLRAYHSLYYSQGRAGLPADEEATTGAYAGYGYHDRRVPLRPLVKVHPDTGRPNLLHRPPRLRHRRDGARRVRAVPRRAQRVGLPGPTASTSTSGRSATR